MEELALSIATHSTIMTNKSKLLQQCVFVCPGRRYINLLTPNVNYSGRTAPLTSIKLHFIYLFNIYRY